MVETQVLTGKLAARADLGYRSGGIDRVRLATLPNAPTSSLPVGHLPARVHGQRRFSGGARPGFDGRCLAALKRYSSVKS